MAVPQNCLRCRRAMYSRWQSGAQAGHSRDETGRLVQSAEPIKHHCRGLCCLCWRAARDGGTLSNYAPLQKGRPAGNIVEDFYFIAETSGTRAENVIGFDKRTRETTAARLGVPVATLDRALYRDMSRRNATLESSAPESEAA